MQHISDSTKFQAVDDSDRDGELTLNWKAIIINSESGRRKSRTKREQKLRVIQYSNKTGRDETYDKKKGKEKVGRDEEHRFRRRITPTEKEECLLACGDGCRYDKYLADKTDDITTKKGRASGAPSDVDVDVDGGKEIGCG